MTRLRRFAAALALALALLTVTSLEAQIGPGRGTMGPSGGGWAPIVGARVGWSLQDQSPSLGAALLFPIPLPRVPMALTAGGDLVFQDGLIDRQGTLDLTVGLTGGVYAGGGPAVLNSVFADEIERQTKIGYTLAAGVRGNMGGFDTQLEFRWLRVAGLKPAFLMLAFTLPVPGL